MSKEGFRDFLNKSVNAAKEGMAEALVRREEDVYNDAIELGISKTIAALHDANVKDIEIIRVMNKYWGMASPEVKERLLEEKYRSVKDALRDYLEMEGYNESEIRQFMRENRVSKKIHENRELWKLKNNPEKLIKALTENTNEE